MSLEDLKARNEQDGAYILVDWDRTLRQYNGWITNGETFGDPVPAMVERVQRWLHTGTEVRIFTARVSHDKPEHNAKEEAKIKAACVEMFGKELKVQNWKCFKCIAIWDDLAVTVDANRGWRMTNFVYDGKDPLSKAEEVKLTTLAYKRS